MSLYDVSKLSGPGTIRPTGRDMSGARPEAKTAKAESVADKGVAVQTGSRVSAGDVPVDNDRVAQIREALRDGSYPIVPAKITDAIIAARLMLSNGQ
ncbi:flagellar biosynthesis anti-sigma factor FlgM [Alteraurantiacibacter aquimixticola]|uniref:Flagellar biosynthesis anti-sigma factor FlgM n=1 Tax=Alteraurantiacibacter aquimixticola TaxID=2489173 RepID=A0A4V4U8W2_9SPHN|nr:flagellar biosynthesis anti-sigma factor FlgM [Alteraurantiacibacter aquimixticola]TIX51507.1 flagellar biosynthesis anti-sigma factor FlgM [Alteraurantiacibacter aquimixticola]